MQLRQHLSGQGKKQVDKQSSNVCLVSYVSSLVLCLLQSCAHPQPDRPAAETTLAKTQGAPGSLGNDIGLPILLVQLPASSAHLAPHHHHPHLLRRINLRLRRLREQQLPGSFLPADVKRLGQVVDVSVRLPRLSLCIGSLYHRKMEEGEESSWVFKDKL